MTEEDVRNWLNGFKAAWEAQDPKRFAALFAPGCEYRDTPFSVPILYDGFGQFWADLAREQQDNDMSFEAVEVLGGNRAIAFWRAFTTRRASGERTEGDGVMLLTFDAGGLCCDLREWQHARVAGTGLVARVVGDG